MVPMAVGAPSFLLPNPLFFLAGPLLFLLNAPEGLGFGFLGHPLLFLALLLFRVVPHSRFVASAQIRTITRSALLWFLGEDYRITSPQCQVHGVLFGLFDALHLSSPGVGIFVFVPVVPVNVLA